MGDYSLAKRSRPSQSPPAASARTFSHQRLKGKGGEEGGLAGPRDRGNLPWEAIHVASWAMGWMAGVCVREVTGSQPLTDPSNR